MAIRAVLFDFGGVYTSSPFSLFAEAAAELGATPEHMLDLVFGPYDRDTDHPWHRLERGELSLLEARDAIIALAADAGLAFDPLAILARMAKGGGAREAVVAATRRLRERGLRMALVTNNAREFSAGWRAMLPLAELFDAVIDSSEVGMRKPDPAIFSLALRELGDIAPEHAVFLDDFPGNVAAARRLGMHGVLVEDDPSGALAELERLLR
ncbi:MAG: HAD family phosphatase [Deltaproteobacteria bacterium]|nr:MAG: HAD family phosphatase [Deltaproteobacteria bacterium]